MLDADGGWQHPGDMQAVVHMLQCGRCNARVSNCRNLGCSRVCFAPLVLKNKCGKIIFYSACI
jgi:hypothetical protein